MPQIFSRPDRHISLCGHLRAAVVDRHVAGAPAFLRGLRVLFASDFHAVRRTSPEDIRALAAQIRGLRPNLILLGGDYADRTEDAARLFEHLAPLTAPLGCFGVPGNNDREAWRDMEALRKTMAWAGCRLLVNESVAITVGDGTLWLAGLDDRLYGRPDPAGLYPPSPSGDAYRLLLYHEPCAVAPAPDMMLSGHTHGGQFNAFGLTPYVIGFELLYARRIAPLAVAGWHDANGMRLLVSKGIGASRIPLRVGVRPEIELLRFE